MKKGNTMSTVGFEPTSLAFRASVLPLHHVGPLLSQYTHPHLCVQLLASEVSADYYTGPLVIVSLFIAYNYIEAMTLHGMVNNHTANSLPCLRSQCRLLHKYAFSNKVHDLLAPLEIHTIPVTI